MKAVVIGASSGLGRCIGVGLAQRGAEVALLARRHDRLVDAAKEAGPGALAIRCDVTDEASCRAAIEEAAAGLGGIDALVYATGIGPLSRIEDLDADTWRRAFDTNVIGASLVTAAALPHLRTSSGAAAYLSSVSASLTPPWPGLAAYLVSKAALDKMVEAWRTEHPELGFTRVTVGDCPGGEGESMTQFANEWNSDLAIEVGPIWMQRNLMNGGFIEVDELVTLVHNVVSHGSSASIPSVTITPRAPTTSNASGGTMTDVMQGVRVLEVAEHTFVPAASALLADWGAEIIKIEHVERGDAMRGLAATGVVADMGNDVHPLLEHSNRGKKSLGLDLTAPDGLDILHKLIATSDVFLTNKLPRVIKKLHIDVDEVRAHNEKIIYVRGHGQGARGPDADKGSYDSLAFWARAGVAIGATRPEYDLVVNPPAPGFGDSIGAMTIAGGIMGALFHRERTGEATVVDVSLFGTGLWAMGQAVALSLQMNIPWTAPPADQMRFNPLVAMYDTSDGRLISLCCLQAGQYWAPLCEAIGRPELATDPRFADHAALLDHTTEAQAILREVFATRTVDEWRAALEDFVGQWTVVQHTLEAAADPQAVANGYIQDVATASGTPFQLTAAPVQFDEVPPTARRAPEFNEHGDEILAELGLDWDTVIDLKVRGVVA